MNRHNEDVRYVINEEKRTIVAILTVPEDEICAELCNIIYKHANSYFAVTEIMVQDALLLTGTYRGVAKAHPDDEWDVEAGKKRARYRARKLYMKERKRIVKALEDIFDDIKDNMEKAVDFTKNVLKHIDEDMDALDADDEKDEESEEDDD